MGTSLVVELHLDGVTKGVKVLEVPTTAPIILAAVTVEATAAEVIGKRVITLFDGHITVKNY